MADDECRYGEKKQIEVAESDVVLKKIAMSENRELVTVPAALAPANSIPLTLTPATDTTPKNDSEPATNLRCQTGHRHGAFLLFHPLLSHSDAWDTPCLYPDFQE